MKPEAASLAYHQALVALDQAAALFEAEAQAVQDALARRTAALTAERSRVAGFLRKLDAQIARHQKASYEKLLGIITRKSAVLPPLRRRVESTRALLAATGPAPQAATKGGRA